MARYIFPMDTMERIKDSLPQEDLSASAKNKADKSMKANPEALKLKQFKRVAPNFQGEIEEDCGY